MNQILQVKDTKLKSKSKIAKKVILFLIGIIILFGLVLGGYYIYQNINNGNIMLPFNKPTISIMKTEDNTVFIRVEGKVKLSSITYRWNDEQPQTIELNGQTNIEQIINIPLLENILSISVTDINGKETQKQERIILEQPKPLIELSVVGNDIKIIVTSEIELSTVTYQWNEADVKKEDILTYENRNEFEKKLEIPLGQNTLKITAEDINGSKAELTQEIKGVTRPTTAINQKDGYLHFTVTGNENIVTVEFEFNGQKYLMNTDTFGETKRVHYKVKLERGMNYLTVKGTTQSGGVNISSWQGEYTK